MIYAGALIPLWPAYSRETFDEMLFGCLAAMLGVHTAVPNWTGRLPLESTGLHLARWMHRVILIGVDRMRGSLCDRRGMSRFPCDEDFRSRIGADLDELGQS